MNKFALHADRVAVLAKFVPVAWLMASLKGDVVLIHARAPGRSVQLFHALDLARAARQKLCALEARKFK